MKILSFDVGVKNLAYCLLDDNNYIIEDWGILNISIDDVCEYCGKNNKKCEKSAKYKTIDNKYNFCLKILIIKKCILKSNKNNF